MSDKIECWQCGCEYDEDECFCPECDADIEPDEPIGSTLVANKIAQKSYLAVICSQCGGGIMLAGDKMTGTCRHCGTAFVANPSVVKPSANQYSKATASSVYKPPKTSQKKSAKIWTKLFAEHTPNCQFCGEPQGLTIGYLFHEMKYLLRCKHCQAEFKCDFTFGGKIKAWTAEIVHCGKANQNEYKPGHSDIDKIALNGSSIARESGFPKWFFNLSKKWRSRIVGFAWGVLLAIMAVFGFLLSKYETQYGVQLKAGTPLGITALVIFPIGLTLAVFFTSKAKRATHRDSLKNDEKDNEE